MSRLTAFVAGSLFAIGLVISGMTQPAKIIGFLDVSGSWDPTLAFVMCGALAIYTPLFRLITRRHGPILDTEFHLPTKRAVDRRLVAGAALFGIGWGLAGYCPGPAITSLPTMSHNVLGVTLGLVIGIFAVRLGRRLTSG